VNAGTGDFTRGVQAFDVCPALHVGFYSAHHVMDTGIDRDRCTRDIQVETHAGLKYFWETFFYELGFQSGQIKISRTCVGRFKFRDDRLADDVSWRQIGEFVIIRHKFLARCIDQLSTFASEGFGKKEPGETGQKQSRGMKLHEFHIFQMSARPEGDGHTIPCGECRIGCLLVNTA